MCSRSLPRLRERTHNASKAATHFLSLVLSISHTHTLSLTLTPLCARGVSLPPSLPPSLTNSLISVSMSAYLRRRTQACGATSA